MLKLEIIEYDSEWIYFIRSCCELIKYVLTTYSYYEILFLLTLDAVD